MLEETVDSSTSSLIDVDSSDSEEVWNIIMFFFLMLQLFMYYCLWSYKVYNKYIELWYVTVYRKIGHNAVNTIMEYTQK